MTAQPPIALGDWIEVGSTDCVVMNIYKAESSSGVCQVVFNKKKPTTHDVDWDGTKWFFPERPDYGGYGRDGNKFVEILKRGKPNNQRLG